MTPGYVDLILMALIAWLLALTGYVWRKSRTLFRRQTVLNLRVSQQKVESIDSLHLEVMKHARLLEVSQVRPSTVIASIPHRFTAQMGEDLVLFDFFRDASPGFFVEAGAYDGVTFSNTYLLESLGWRGLLVEPNPRMADICRQQRPAAIVEQKALGPDGSAHTVEFTAAEDPRGGSPLSFVEATLSHIERCRTEQCRFEVFKVDLVSLNSLLEQRTDRVDFLSLDVEGMEIDALRGFDLGRFRPRIALIELQRDHRDVVVQEFMNENGYRCAGVVGCNSFYAGDEDVTLLGNLIANLFGPKSADQGR